MKKMILLAFAFLYTFNLYAEFNFETNIKIQNNLGFKLDNIYIGAKVEATNGLDLNLGEQDLPTFEPPNPDIFAYLLLENEGATLWSYRDYRAVPETENKFSYIYKLYINYGAAKSIDISWNQFGEEVDSAFIEDGLDGVVLFRCDMKKNQTVKVENHLLNDYIITVWYNKKNTSILENNKKSDNFVYPNPAENEIMLGKEEFGQEISIYNSLGFCVLKQVNSSGSINIEKLEKGFYILKYNNTILKFIKI